MVWPQFGVRDQVAVWAEPAPDRHANVRRSDHLPFGVAQGDVVDGSVVAAHTPASDARIAALEREELNARHPVIVTPESRAPVMTKPTRIASGQIRVNQSRGVPQLHETRKRTNFDPDAARCGDTVGARRCDGVACVACSSVYGAWSGYSMDPVAAPTTLALPAT